MEVLSEESPKETAECAVSNSVNNESMSTPPPAEVQKQQEEVQKQQEEVQKKSKKEDKNSKKDDKVVEQFMKSLNSISNMDEKFSAVCKKYVQTAEDNKKLQFYIKQSDKRHALLQKEKEHLQHEYNKTILVKSKLENLCRELQKQNKAIKEESLLKIREEEERRKETQTKFQNTLSEITALLQQNNEKNVKLRDDNISMSEKFKSVVQQYQLREQQVDKMAKQMALESQLADAKMQKSNLEHQAEREKILAEMEQMKVTVAQYRAKVVELQGIEAALKGQLAVYTDKYDEFQNALVKSNQVFGGFKEQMEMMSKKIKKLEKESLSWKKRWETSQTALLDMCGERQATEERVSATTRQLQHMQSLCRTLQAERTVLLNTLKEHNIERPPLPAPTPAPPPPPAPVQAPAKDAKMDAMVANCAQLRQSLAHLQTQLNVLTNNKNGAKEEPAKPEKPKKSKAKKSKAEKQPQQSENNTPESNGAKESASVNEESSDNAEAQNEATNNEAVSEDKPDEDPLDAKVDEKTMDSLLQAISLANMNLNDLENVSDEVNNKVDIVNDLPIAVEEIKPVDVAPTPDEPAKEAGDKVTPIEQVAASNPNEEVAHIAEVKPIAVADQS
ncbi:myosin-like coiled-coil protein domain-containing protein [Phthorimaea operculella]|nr:myosin-like coiled-coil protein domain-containing protein [Phthorimaea operculella]